MKTEEKIILTTIKWINEEDYHQLSMRKLAAKINMTTGALYKYFKNKDELFYQVSIILSQQIANQLRTDPSKPAQQQLLTIAQSFCNLCKTKPQLINFLFFNSSLTKFYANPDNRFPFYNQVMQLLHQVNPGLLSDHQFFNQVWSFIQGYSLLIINKVTKYDQRLVELTLRQLMRGEN